MLMTLDLTPRPADPRTLSLAAAGGSPPTRRAAAEPARTIRPKLTRLALRAPGEVRFLDVASIDSIDAAGNYCRLWVGGQAHRIRRGITELEHRLDPEQFLRVHRSTLVNLEHIESLRIARNGQYLIILRGGRRLSVGRTYRAALAERLLLDDDDQ
jgi:two-component system LytT family response regulator